MKSEINGWLQPYHTCDFLVTSKGRGLVRGFLITFFHVLVTSFCRFIPELQTVHDSSLIHFHSASASSTCYVAQLMTQFSKDFQINIIGEIKSCLRQNKEHKRIWLQDHCVYVCWHFPPVSHRMTQGVSGVRSMKGKRILINADWIMWPFLQTQVTLAVCSHGFVLG